MIKEKKRGFTTFQGVFRPTLLTILGVMLYLREGWIVGNAGLLGALLIILIVYLITGTTAFSLSCISTNTRTSSGGVFSIISQSLGLEVGGSIGIPFYLAQSLSGAMYMHGFLEGWLYLFPDHNSTVVLLILFFSLLSLSYINTNLAFNTQFFILFILVIAIIAMFASLFSIEKIHTPQLWGSFPQEGFWTLFAVFFPAGTGIMVGSSLSGELKNSRRSIPLGTLLAWGTSFLVYVSIAILYSLIASPEILQNKLDIGITASPFPIIVVIGLLASCFSASLSSFSAAPRIAQALAQHRIIGLSNFLSQKTKKGEPKNAILFTSVLIFITVSLGDLNTIAKILTMFFLITYFSINMILFIEQKVNMVSFRPVLKIPIGIPILGSLMSFITILIINPFIGIISLAGILIIYYYLHYKKLVNPWDTVRSGIFMAIVNWASKNINDDDRYIKRSWKPDLLIFTSEKGQLESIKKIICPLIYPQGSIQVINFTHLGNKDVFLENKRIVDEIRKENKTFTSCCNVNISSNSTKENTAPKFFDAQIINNCISVTRSSVLHPNTLFYTINTYNSDKDLKDLQNIARLNKIGLVLAQKHAEKNFQNVSKINLWIRDQSPDWDLGLRMTNFNYQLLIACQFNRNIKTKINIITITTKEEYKQIALKSLKKVASLARLQNVTIKVYCGRFLEVLGKVDTVDLNIMGFTDALTMESVNNLSQNLESSCLFVLDSGIESAFA